VRFSSRIGTFSKQSFWQKRRETKLATTISSKLTIDGRLCEYDLHGDFSWGSDEVLYREGADLLENTRLKTSGFANIPFLCEAEQVEFRAQVMAVINRILAGLAAARGRQLDTLETYHEVVNDPQLHREVILQTRELRFSDLGLDPRMIETRVGNQLGLGVSAQVKGLGRDHIQLRISRPGSLDINPPHRDAYLDVWKNVLNLWLPICGCTAQSSLPVMPGSHLFNERDVFRTPSGGAVIDGNQYRVPGIADTRMGMNMIRPNPATGEVLAFTPFLIHGAAFNHNADSTRMALEFRLEIHDQCY
jgi:hypothetical protein